MKLVIKLISAFLAVGILISIAGYLSYNQVNSIASAFSKVESDDMPALWALGEIESAILRIELEPLEYMNKPDPEHPEELKEAEASILAALAVYGQSGREEKAGRMAEEVRELVLMGEEIFMLKDSGASEQVLNEKFAQLDDRLDIFVHELDEEEQLITRNTQDSFMVVSDDIQLTLNLTAILAAIAAAIAILVGVYNTYSISKPISRLRDAAREIGRGNFNVETQVTKSTDEIGELSAQFGKMKEGLSQKERMQNEFISVASHELRTPVQSVLGFADLAVKGQVPLDEALKKIMKEGKRLQRLTNDILDVSRIEGGRIGYMMEDVKLNELVMNAVNSCRVNVGSGVSLKTMLNTGEDLVIRGDRERLTQVLANVLDNAVKFTKEGAIVVETSSSNNGKREVTIKISDTGGGISQDLLPNLFGKFVTKGIGRENKQGTGLGLFISRAIVEAHNGNISAHNNGAGATFTISLPVTS
jgi:signal transduction histidine kinase